MTIAELEGKLSRKGTNAHERAEDLLTSDVFGTFLYSERWDLLGKWFCRAVNLAGNKLGERFSGLKSPQSAKIDFWPTSEEREPDVVLALTGENGREYGLCVEAKYKSGKSQLSLDDDDETDEVSGEEDEETLAMPSGDQLHDQWHQIQKGHPYGWRSDRSRRVVVFVTAHASIPVKVLKDTVQAGKECGAVGLEEDIYWLGWCKLHQILGKEFAQLGRARQVAEAGAGCMVYDLYRLLERKGLRYYRGYSNMECPDGIYRYPGFWNLFEIDAPTFETGTDTLFLGESK